MSISKVMIPKSLEALREELPKHKDVYDYAILGKTFEECLERIATKLNVVIHGLYDVDKMCDMLLWKLKQHKTPANYGKQDTLLVNTSGDLILPVDFQKKPTIQ